MVGVNNRCGQSGSYASKYTNVSGCYSMILSPNPASDILNVKISKEQIINTDSINIIFPSNVNSDKTITYKVKLEDNMGFVFYTNNEFSDSFMIPLQTIKDGNYIITVQFEETQISSPFIKMHK